VPLASLRKLPEQFPFSAKEPILRNLNQLLVALESRFEGVELGQGTFDEEVQKFRDLGLQKINENITPLVEQAIERLEQVANLFSAHSATSNAVGLGAKQFIVDAEQSLTFIPSAYISFVAPAGAATMIGSLDNYEAETGTLNVTILAADGVGTYADWELGVSAPPAGAGVTLGQMNTADAATLAAANSAAGASVNSLRTELLGGTPPAGLNSIAELAVAVASNPNFAADVLTFLNAKAWINSPAFTGVPTAPTAGGTVNTNQVATMAAVQAAMAAFSTKAPYDLGDIAGGATLSINPALGPVQMARKMAAMTLAAPTTGGFVMLYILNGPASSGGAMSFSGFEKALSGGDAWANANNERHLIQIQSIVAPPNWSGTQSYQIKKLS
jgi:hypothetical protein